ncbi:multicopper oxidase family protein [Lactiplantibacillus daoliensis]|uniref:Multicopper oxidase family protein n=1 Tax=Lactiplantibacillus daoliensis TaxID=2559916 RepID=A0ABW1UEZ8_9LACO|nr:multicopper oxidase domain-containing protein [Lactiplantibacillus daoliensis]
MKASKWGLIGVVSLGLLGIGIAIRQTRPTMMGQTTHGSGMMSRSTTSTKLATTPTASHKLALPPLLKPDRSDANAVSYTVTAQKGAMAFKDGRKTQTLGYNGNYLGPVLQVKQGQTLNITTKNQLNEATSFHWHGAVVPGEMDGGPHEPVAADATKQVSFKVTQPAATLWFHPHVMGSTAKQVYQGLTGLIYVNDQASQKLNLPHDYGKDDFPVIIQDRQFSAANQFDYDKAYSADGTTGPTLLMNGTLNPYVNVKTKLVRLRLVNGSNARNYHLTLSNQQAMQQIADDGGLLARPVAVKKLALAPGERAEVVVDTNKLAAGQPLAVMAGKQRVLQLRLAKHRRTSGQLPTKLATLPTVDTAGAQHQSLTFSGMGHMVAINDQTYSAKRIDLTAKVGQPQVWTLKNARGMMSGRSHPFHLHGVQFRILSINGKQPPANERGWKDTVDLASGSTVKIAFTFKNRGIYMYHCHNLEHEEQGMMGQIKVS